MNASDPLQKRFRVVRNQLATSLCPLLFFFDKNRRSNGTSGKLHRVKSKPVASYIKIGAIA